MQRVYWRQFAALVPRSDSLMSRMPSVIMDMTYDYSISD